MKRINFFILFVLTSMAFGCGKKSEQNDTLFLTGPSFSITGDHDGRELNTHPDRTTVAITRGASLDTVCSGTTIGISHVITAAHCIYDSKTKKIKSDLTVVPGLHMAGNHKSSPRFFISKVFILKDYIQDIEWNGYTSYAASKDIAIIQVREFQDNSYYFDDHSHKLKIVDSSAFKLKGEKLSLIGYTGGGNDTLDNSQYVQHKTCESKGRRYNYTSFTHDCDTTPGASGMGMVAEDSDGYGIVVGVHTGEAGSSAGLNNAAYLTKEVLDEIKNKITLFKGEDLKKFKVFDYGEVTNEKLYVGYQVRNNCSETVYVSIYYKNLDGKFYIKDPMKLTPGQLKIFSSKTQDIKVKYHAKSSSGRLLNNKDVTYSINGEKMAFQSLSFPNLFTDNEIVICQ